MSHRVRGGDGEGSAGRAIVTQTAGRHKERGHKSETPPEPEGFSDVSLTLYTRRRVAVKPGRLFLSLSFASGDPDDDAIRRHCVGGSAPRDHRGDRLEVLPALLEELLILVVGKDPLQRSQDAIDVDIQHGLRSGQPTDRRGEVRVGADRGAVALAEVDGLLDGVRRQTDHERTVDDAPRDRRRRKLAVRYLHALVLLRL